VLQTDLTGGALHSLCECMLAKHLTALIMIAAFQDVMLCSLVERYCKNNGQQFQYHASGQIS
jgi:hypothetical protein